MGGKDLGPEDGEPKSSKKGRHRVRAPFWYMFRQRKYSSMPEKLPVKASKAFSR